ncbi:Transcription factor, MADS-box [Corchorus capsularis]|uniref:Transcription factor, MADS-box n=1 Tax=Corchorus capsularis TaxID=210143 RepID=A0A1R3HVP6_COCAP|nr:Transcription factor, MADS-box [Corchorus capsularis]
MTDDGKDGNKEGAASGKRTKGRQRIEIKQLEKKSNLHVTFSKRRKGLFQKASELCLLSGAKIGIIVLSPTPRQKPFCFGHPNIDKILDQYVSETQNPTDAAAVDDDDHDQDGETPIADLSGLEEIDKKFEGSVEMLEMEKKRGKDQMENNGGTFWWEEDIEGMGLEELEMYVNALEKLKKNVIVRANALTMANVMETSSALPGFAQNLSGFRGLQ